MDFNNQFQVPTQPTGPSKSKVMWLIIIGFVLIALSAYWLWAMNSASTVVQNSQPASTQPSDDLNTLDQEAAAFNAASLDADFQGQVTSEMGN